MIHGSLRHLALGIAMLAAAATALALTPTARMADERKRPDFEQLIPKAFGDWTIDKTVLPLQVPPDVQAQLDSLYSQTVSRTYRNSQGHRIMLSLAYGDSQSRSLQVHRPEVCYVAQGFSVGQLNRSSLDAANASIPVMHLVAQHGARVEPITYWVRFGDKVVRGNIEQGLARLQYGLVGQVADGLLVRVSSISRQPEGAYRLQAEFVDDLLRSLPRSDRRYLIGGPD
jgi:EpsI family protein